MKSRFSHDNKLYDYEIEFSDNKEFEFEVLPNQKIVVKTPPNSRIETVESFLTEKWAEIKGQIEQIKGPNGIRMVEHYIEGESLYFLDRLYKLQIEAADSDSVKLGHETLHIYTTQDPQDGLYNKKLIDEWYETQRETIYSEQLKKAAALFGYDSAPKISKRPITRRWSSTTPDGEVHFNPYLIEASREAIYCVCVHELCHRITPKHDKLFYAELEKRLPKWRRIKDRLEIRHGRGFNS